ncbi:hypothetical protein BDF20DRAFT_876251 [Mycotypha africana]|uniref:uncharacterized protein n=1 Tax=Mycotypha africana TaxID=64632 RepID=UPI002301C0C0|nr:uncharacterized protein BDF20DRAFT_876251 [Mycotypha africana]KAI8977678.1 hypothetical protein BDF20DRAFT_876251 [Mycotypha africana]
MKLIFGYEMDAAAGHIGHVICPPLLSKKITLSSTGNTNRWIFYGTRRQILDWIKDHANIILENVLFTGDHKNINSETQSYLHTELIIDLQHVYDQEQSYTDYFKSFFVDIHDVERVKVEIRPRIDSKDSVIPSLNRVIVANGTSLGDIVDELETEWFKPSASYAQQTIHLFTDAPTPSHVVSAKPPTSIQVTNPEATTTSSAPAPTEAGLPVH